jgi:hypothetical protein
MNRIVFLVCLKFLLNNYLLTNDTNENENIYIFKN